MNRGLADFDVQNATIRVVNWHNLRRIDWLMPICVILLAMVGWALLYSAGRGIESSVAYYQKQIVFFLLGLVGIAVIVCVDYRFFVSLAPIMYLAALVLLVGVLAVGKIAGGSERWFALGPFRFQPSEFCKLVMVYALTWYLTTIKERIRKLHWFLLAFIITLVPMALILKQPNLGTAAALGPLVVVMVYAAGCRLWHLGIVILVGLSIIPFTWWQMKDFKPDPDSEVRAEQKIEHAANRQFYELHWHQKMRIYTFLHPEEDPRGSAWQTIQSKITVGSGGLSGKGFLKGTQTQLNYLPEHHTDFIFSVLAEEQGFIGAVVVIGLFAAFLLRGLMFARDCPDMMGTLLATGVVTILAFHVFVNIAITTGLMPVTGIPLPFLSYGGSFYLTTMAGVGVLLNVPMRRFHMFVN